MRDLGYFEGWIMGWGGEVRGITLAVGGGGGEGGGLQSA